MTIEEIKSLQYQYGYDDMPLGDFANRLRKKYGSIDNVKQALKYIPLPSQVSPTEAEPTRPTLPAFPPDPKQLGADVRERVGGAVSNYINGLKRQSQGFAGLIDNSSALNTPEGRETAMSALNYSPASMGMIKNLYHGSPYKFTKFANEKIGTGEGAQAFGYGHYLTEAPEVAKSYAKNVKPTNITIGGKNIETYLTPQEIEQYPDLAYRMGVEFKHKVKSAGVKNTINDYLSNDYKPSITDRIFNRILKQSKDIDMGDTFYTATINKGKPSSADVFLEWDKKIPKEQIPVINQIIKDAQIDHVLLKEDSKLGYYGEEIYKMLSKSLGDSKASAVLSGNGITGIKYPTGTLSGIKGSDKYNYVVFDPKNITIDAINGEPIGLLDKRMSDYYKYANE